MPVAIGEPTEDEEKADDEVCADGFAKTGGVLVAIDGSIGSEDGGYAPQLREYGKTDYDESPQCNQQSSLLWAGCQDSIYGGGKIWGVPWYGRFLWRMDYQPIWPMRPRIIAL